MDGTTLNVQSAAEHFYFPLAGTHFSSLWG